MGVFGSSGHVAFCLTGRGLLSVCAANMTSTMATHAGGNSGLRYTEQVHQLAYAMFLTVPDDRERSESCRFGEGYQEVFGGWTLIMRMRLCAPGSEERRGGKECVSPCRCRWARSN